MARAQQRPQEKAFPHVQTRGFNFPSLIQLMAEDWMGEKQRGK